jgi:hypothetical protein
MDAGPAPISANGMDISQMWWATEDAGEGPNPTPSAPVLVSGAVHSLPVM